MGVGEVVGMGVGVSVGLKTPTVTPTPTHTHTHTLKMMTNLSFQQIQRKTKCVGKFPLHISHEKGILRRATEDEH